MLIMLRSDVRGNAPSRARSRSGGRTAPWSPTPALLLLGGLAATIAGCNSGDRSPSPSASTAAPVASASSSPASSTTTAPITTAPPAAQPTAGTFSPGTDLNAARGQHSATLLADGRVLVVGGTDGQGILADSEVFDPLTNTWTVARNLGPAPNNGLMMDPTGAFPTARQLHTATLLANGSVLVAGGLGVERLDPTGQPIFEALSSAYLFDPATNTFRRAGTLATARAWHLATRTPAGQVVLAGGLDGTLSSTATAAVFDPATGSFTQVPMGGHHTWGGAVETPGGALVIGGANVVRGQQGFGLGGFPAARCELFFGRPLAGSAPAAPSNERIFLAAAAYGAGSVLVAGGQTLNGQAMATTDTTEVFDGTAWTAGPTLRTARFGATLARIGTTDDQLLVGGSDAQGGLLRSCEVYIAATKTIVGTTDMQVPRGDFAVVTLADGRILVTGGLDAQGAGLRQTEVHTR